MLYRLVRTPSSPKAEKIFFLGRETYIEPEATTDTGEHKVNEQEYVAARKQLVTSIQSFKASKQRIISDFLKEHYPDVEFTIELSDNDLSVDILLPKNTEQSKAILQELNAYFAGLNKQAEE